jgi:hypothetical protein
LGSDNPKDGQKHRRNKKIAHLTVGFITGNIQDTHEFVNVGMADSRVVSAAVFLYGMESNFKNDLAVMIKGSLEWI